MLPSLAHQKHLLSKHTAERTSVKSLQKRFMLTIILKISAFLLCCWQHGASNYHLRTSGVDKQGA